MGELFIIRLSFSRLKKREKRARRHVPEPIANLTVATMMAMHEQHKGRYCRYIKRVRRRKGGKNVRENEEKILIRTQ